MVFYDAETLIVIANILDTIKRNYFPSKTISLHYNNRKILEGLLGNEEHKQDLYALFDKYYKINENRYNDGYIKYNSYIIFIKFINRMIFKFI
jgi:histidyl-tRNA synthetase